MPGTQRLTERLVRAAPAQKNRRHIFDAEVPGFGVAIYRLGRRAFTLACRTKGRRRRYTIGGWPNWNVSAARDRAKLLKREIEMGCDPLAQRDEDREAAPLLDLIDGYVSVHLANPTSAHSRRDQESILRMRVEPEWRRMLVSESTPADVAKLLDKIAEGRARRAKKKPKAKRRKKLRPPGPTPVRANRCGEAIRKMFNEAVALKMRPDSPASGFRPRPESERER